MKRVVSHPTGTRKQTDMAKTLDREYYTVPEAADILGVSTSTIWRWIKAGRLPAYRIGARNIRIKKVDLNTVIRPADEASMEEEREDIWAGYDPEKVKEALKHTAGSWADLDTDSLIAELYEARARGSRPGARPE